MNEAESGLANTLVAVVAGTRLVVSLMEVLHYLVKLLHVATDEVVICRC
jgi:hypothetical protein